VNVIDNRRALSSSEGFDPIFEMVKTATERTLGRHRAGLTLVLGDIPNDVGAYHQMGSNTIVMNRNLLRIVEKLSRTRSKRNSYVFMILLHEYLHSLGFTSDRQVRSLGKQISDEFLGRRHMASEMAVRPPTSSSQTLKSSRVSETKESTRPSAGSTRPALRT